MQHVLLFVVPYVKPLCFISLMEENSENNVIQAHSHKSPSHSRSGLGLAADTKEMNGVSRRRGQKPFFQMCKWDLTLCLFLEITFNFFFSFFFLKLYLKGVGKRSEKVRQKLPVFPHSNLQLHVVNGTSRKPYLIMVLNFSSFK